MFLRHLSRQIIKASSGLSVRQAGLLSFFEPSHSARFLSSRAAASKLECEKSRPRRQIILDTETSGLSPKSGHRIIEIGCVELINRQLTGSHFHRYLNPERDIDAGAQAVHGITAEFLSDKPVFADVAADFIKYINGAELVIHNAPFDVRFLNHEFSLHRLKQSITDMCSVVDTLAMARKLYPGQRNTLDALCDRYSVDNKKREIHGALLDANILAEVYLAMREDAICKALLEDKPNSLAIHL